MTFKFECPYCGQRISATAGQVETTGVCPACQRDVDVPSGPAVAPALAEIPIVEPTVVAPAPVVAAEPPQSVAHVPPAAAPQQRPPARPVKPVARPVPVPVPVHRRAPVYTPPIPDDEWEEETSPPGLPVFTLLLCALPIPGLIILRIAGLGDVAPFGTLLGGAAAVSLLGIILAHRACWRSKRRLFARLLSFVGLLLGYASAFAIGSMALVMDTNRPVVAKQNEEVPDFKPKGGDVVLTEPSDLKPKGGELATAEPPAKPASAEPAKPEPTAAPPAMASIAAADAADPAQFFEAKIHPLLEDKCYKCHSEKSGKSKGGLTLDTRAALLKGGETGPGVEPGKPDASLLIKAVLYTDDNLQMPPKGEKLSDREIADLTAWVKMGAPYAAKDK
jgi:mono/diheme cytochrome c family protein